MKPVIGITTDMEKDDRRFLKDTYVNAIFRAGGLPLILPVGIDKDAKHYAALLDGLLLTGGDDIDPMIYDEEPHIGLGKVDPTRDTAELSLIKEFLALNKPIFGICRGMQVINVALGGNIYQDIYRQKTGILLQHKQNAPTSHPSHFVQVEAGSLLASIAKLDDIKVNSFHHQAVKKVPKPLHASGVASDGVIEAIESTVHPFVLGVQWHPEAMTQNRDAVSLRMFDAFVEKCKESRK